MSPRTAIASLAALLVSCAFHETGLVSHEENGTILERMDGRRFHLVLPPTARALSYLDGHTADVWGNSWFHHVRVTDWKIPEGLHGMATWVGTLEERGIQIGLLDRNSGAYYLVDADAAESLAAFAGKPVLLEGYVDGPHRVRVLYFRVLAD